MEMKSVLKREIYPYLPEKIRDCLDLVQPSVLNLLVEIRLRIKQPLLLVSAGSDYYLALDGEIKQTAEEAYFCTQEDILQVVQAICKNSFYALEEELRNGYITLDGGHRVGIAGQAVLENGAIKTFKNFNALNIRLAREVKHCADKLFSCLFDKDRKLKNTLLISPPRCGKTTLLRDIVRRLSSGSEDFRGMQIGLVDERSEIAACKNGVMTNDLGYRVDVLDGCPKAFGMLTLIRTMAPDVIITDEIGRREDVVALEEALHAGVKVIASVHGKNLDDIKQRPYVNKLIDEGYFDCYVFLSDYPVIGTIQDIIVKDDC